MALRPLRPKPLKEPLAEGWDLLATEAGRADGGLRATIFVLNGDAKDTKRLTFGDEKSKQTFVGEVAALSGLDPALIRTALVKLAYAIEHILRAMQPTGAEAAGAGSAFTFPAVDPWPEEVGGDALLDELAAAYTRYLVLPTGGEAVLALWTLHTYVFDAFDVSPYLTLTSPQKRCGKSTVLMVASALTHAPLLVSNASPAALFRTIEMIHPTFMVDEAETFVRDNEELRGILNSGHTKRTAYVLRTVGDDHEPRMFSTWTPKMLAGIGSLPETIKDRSIVLAMKRKTRQEQVTKWREREVARYTDLRSQCVRWAADHLAALAQADPPVPELASDRAADNWATLLAIADEAGGEWRQRTEQAIKRLSSETEEEDNAAIVLLADLRQAFRRGNRIVIESEVLVTELHRLDERPWSTYGKQMKPITKRQVAWLLKSFGIRSDQHWEGGRNVRGYALDECDDSFQRYLAPESADAREEQDDDIPF